MPRQRKIKGHNSRPSGARGGPSTGHGLNYQIDFATRDTLDYMSRALCAPHRIWEVRIEPRVTTSDELTSWDIGFNPDDSLFEVKLKPTAEEIEEWVARVALDGNENQQRDFHLIYSKGAGRYLNELTRLIRIAIEANGNPADFQSKCNAEGVADNDRYLRALGANAFELLRRMSIDQVPEYLLRSDIEFRARQLASEPGGQRLHAFLFKKFHEAIPHRRSFAIVDLIDEAREIGIELQSPTAADTSDISGTARSALVVLQACSLGIPLEVIAAAVNNSDIESELKELKDRDVLLVDNDLWSMRRLPTPIRSPDEQGVLARCLSALVAHIEQSSPDTDIRPHVRNVIALAGRCKLTSPGLVASVFTKLDKRLKQLGNKRLVWFVANLSIEAAKIAAPPGVKERDAEIVEAEARALICGTSWAFQRLHKISKARVDADESFDLAKDMGLDRTLAFCLKCRGRLCRMEAEAMPIGQTRTLKLHDSINLLNEAIEKFSQLSDFGPDAPDVGDCYSLMGRTYLQLRDFQAARSAIAKAYDRILDLSSKDYIDLLILNGDFEAASGDDRQSARRFYQQALEINPGGDPEISEMRARAYFHSAINDEAAGNRTRAKVGYQSASDIWSQLQDEDFAALAAWHHIRLDEVVSKSALQLLLKESKNPRVRVETVRIHLEKVKLAKPAIGRREEPPMNYWKQLIRKAKQRIASRAERIETEW